MGLHQVLIALVFSICGQHTKFNHFQRLFVEIQTNIFEDVGLVEEEREKM